MATVTPISITTPRRAVVMEMTSNEQRIRPKTIDERFTDFMSDSRVGERRPLENFNGVRKIEAYRGKGYINKITEKLTAMPRLTLIRNMLAVPNSSPTRYADNVTVVDIDGGRTILRFERMELDKPSEGFILQIFREQHDSIKKIYKTFQDLRQDKSTMRLLRKLIDPSLKSLHR